MRFAFTEDQLMFREAVRELLARECTPEHIRYCWINSSGRVDDVWQALADMGVMGMTIAEAHGGLGMDEVDLVLLLEESGRVALPEPLVETVAVAAPLLAESAPAALADEWLPRIAGGSGVIGVGLVGTPFVLAADSADLLIVERADQLVALPGAAARLTAQPSIDGARRLFTVDFDDTDADVIVAGPDGWHAVNRAFDRGALGTAAQLLGLADRMLEMTVDYVKQREQFGVPIGTFQAIKHQLADAALALEFARPPVYAAAYALAHRNGEADDHVSRDVSMAKCLASSAALDVARVALQCHGAIGYTVEYDLHLWMKRTWALASAWGDAAWHRNRVGLAVLGPRPPLR